MFSCKSYPSDRPFLDDVRTEITQQVRRLSHHACWALWCGDNEVIGSLGWYPETRENPKRFLANYDRLNSLLGQHRRRRGSRARRFWPSSPSLGHLISRMAGTAIHVATCIIGTCGIRPWTSRPTATCSPALHPSSSASRASRRRTSSRPSARPEDMNPSSPVRWSATSATPAAMPALSRRCCAISASRLASTIWCSSVKSSRAFAGSAIAPSSSGVQPSRAAWARSTGNSTTPTPSRAGLASTMAASGSSSITWPSASTVR